MAHRFWTPSQAYFLVGCGMAGAGFYDVGKRSLMQYRYLCEFPPESPWEDPYLPSPPPASEEQAVFRELMQAVPTVLAMGILWPGVVGLRLMAKAMVWQNQESLEARMTELEMEGVGEEDRNSTWI